MLNLSSQSESDHTNPADAPYLELVFEQRGAKVYAVVGLRTAGE